MIGERIEQMNDEELTQTFLNLKQDLELIERDQNLIKIEFQKRMDVRGIKKLALESGCINLVSGTERSILNQAKVKEYLGKDLERFMKKSSSKDSVRIMSWESKEVQMKRFIKNEA